MTTYPLARSSTPTCNITTQRRLLIAVLCSLTSFLMFATAHAQSITGLTLNPQLSTGNGNGPKPKPTPTPAGDPEWANVSTDWATGTNWVGNTAPGNSTTNNAANAASFGSTGSSAVNPNVGAARSVGSITFLAGAFSYTIGGAALTIGTGGITDSATNTETFSNTLQPSASQTWTSNAGASLVLNGIVDLNSNAATARTLTLTGAGNFTFGSTIQNSNAGSTGNLTLDSGFTGTATLNGTNTYNGTTTIISGTLAIGNNSALGTSLLTLGGTSANTPTIFASGAARTISNNVSLSTVGTGTATIAGSNDLTINGTVTNSGASRTLTINNSGITTLAGSVFLSELSGTGRTLTIAGTGNTTISGVIANFNGAGTAGSLVDTNTGTLTLSGANTYTGTTTVGSSAGANAGTLKLSGVGVISNAATTVFGGTLDLNGTTQTITSLSLGSGASGSTAIVAIGAGELKLGGDVTYDSSNNPNGGVISGIGSGKLSLNGTRSFIIGNSSAAVNDLTVSAIIQDGSTSSGITKTNTGTLLLSGANTYTGKTSIQNGTVSVSSLNSVVAGSASSSLGAPTTVANGTIDLGNAGATGHLTYTGTGETTDRVINLAGTTGSGIIDQTGTGLLKFTSNFTATGVGTKTLTLQGSTTGTGEIAGAIVDNSGTNKTNVTKTGTGTWTLSGTNTYTGATSVNGGGTLYVNGSLASGSAVTVSNAGTVLGGAGGTINGSVTVNSGAILQGGTGSTGQTLTLTGAVTMNTGSILSLALGAPGAHSTIAMSSPGTLSFATNQDFKFIDVGAAPGNYLGLITGVPDPGTALNTWVIDNTGWAGTFSWDNANGGEIDLNLTAVPEPSTWVAGALAVLGAGYVLRKRFARVLARA